MPFKISARDPIGVMSKPEVNWGKPVPKRAPNPVAGEILGAIDRYRIATGTPNYLGNLWQRQRRPNTHAPPRTAHSACLPILQPEALLYGRPSVGLWLGL